MKTFRQFQENTISPEERQELSKEKLKARRETALEKSRAIPDEFKERTRKKAEEMREKDAQIRAEIAAKRKNNQEKTSGPYSAAVTNAAKEGIKLAAKATKNVITHIRQKKKN